MPPILNLLIFPSRLLLFNELPKFAEVFITIRLSHTSEVAQLTPAVPSGRDDRILVFSGVVFFIGSRLTDPLCGLGVPPKFKLSYDPAGTLEN